METYNISSDDDTDEYSLPDVAMNFNGKEMVDDAVSPLDASPIRGTGSKRGKRKNGAGNTQRKAAKTNATAEKMVNRQKLAEERQYKKQQLAQERANKKAASELQKIYKPGECMKYMCVVFHQDLHKQWYMADVQREVTATGARIAVVTDLSPSLVMWTRTMPLRLTASDGQMALTPKTDKCDRALYIACVKDIETHIREHTLSSHMKRVRRSADCDVTLVVFGVKEYFKSSNRRGGSRPNMTDIELEMALTDLLVSTDCDSVKVDTPNELALLIMQFTKAIAEAPYKKAKRACDEQATFYMRGDSRDCVSRAHLDQEGGNSGRLWQHMVAALPHSSLEVARALCQQYTTPKILHEALQTPDGVKKVSDIGVARSNVPGAKTRRLGPEFTRKLKILFTSNNAKELID